jgi:sigma-E factor negative regulatory protein RseC
MTESEAVVVSVEAEHAWLDITAGAGCGSCEKAAGCSSGDGAGRRRQRIRNTVGARVGDTVIVGVPDGAVLKATLWAYMIPLALALIGVASGLTLGGEALGALGALGGLAIGWFALRGTERRYSGSREPLLTMRVKPAVVQLHRKQPS